jgi:hypothetical protein
MSRPQILINMDAKETGERFMGIPVRWLDSKPVLFRCENERGHVSTWYVKSERLGYNACVECEKPVWITFPEDKDDE